jgi:hypothetical protein
MKINIVNCWGLWITLHMCIVSVEVNATRRHPQFRWCSTQLYIEQPTLLDLCLVSGRFQIHLLISVQQRCLVHVLPVPTAPCLGQVLQGMNLIISSQILAELASSDKLLELATLVTWHLSLDSTILCCRDSLYFTLFYFHNAFFTRNWGGKK